MVDKQVSLDSKGSEAKKIDNVSNSSPTITSSSADTMLDSGIMKMIRTIRIA